MQSSGLNPPVSDGWAMNFGSFCEWAIKMGPTTPQPHFLLYFLEGGQEGAFQNVYIGFPCMFFPYGCRIFFHCDSGCICPCPCAGAREAAVAVPGAEGAPSRPPRCPTWRSPGGGEGAAGRRWVRCGGPPLPLPPLLPSSHPPSVFILPSIPRAMDGSHRLPLRSPFPLTGPPVPAAAAVVAVAAPPAVRPPHQGPQPETGPLRT